MYTITERKVSDEDLYSPENAGTLGPKEWGCAIVGFGFVPVVVLGLFGLRIGGETGQYIGWFLGVLIFTTLMAISRKQRAETKTFAATGHVQEICVQNASCFEVDLHNFDPILAVDIGEEKLLVLQGQWLRDPEIYGCDPSQEDPTEEYINGLPAPHSFPSSEFSLVRRPENGDVISIRPAGRYIAPHLVSGTVFANRALSESQVISGTPGNVLQDLLAIASLSSEPP